MRDVGPCRGRQGVRVCASFKPRRAHVFNFKVQRLGRNILQNPHTRPRCADWSKLCLDPSRKSRSRLVRVSTGVRRVWVSYIRSLCQPPRAAARGARGSVKNEMAQGIHVTSGQEALSPSPQPHAPLRLRPSARESRGTLRNNPVMHADMNDCREPRPPPSLRWASESIGLVPALLTSGRAW